MEGEHSLISSDIIGKTALVALTKAYTLSDMSMRPKKYSKDKRNTPPKNDTDREQIIIRPALTLLGFGTHAQMSEILCEENFESGGYVPVYVFLHPLRQWSIISLRIPRLPLSCI